MKTIHSEERTLCFNLYHDEWVDKRYRHSIYLPYTLAQPLIFPYTLGCMVAKTTNIPAVALVITIHKKSDTKVELNKAAYIHSDQRSKLMKIINSLLCQTGGVRLKCSTCHNRSSKNVNRTTIKIKSFCNGVK